MENTIFPINTIMTIAEAAQLYGVKQDTLKSKFKPSVVDKERIQSWIDAGLVRKSGTTWLITKQFMDNNYRRN